MSFPLIYKLDILVTEFDFIPALSSSNECWVFFLVFLGVVVWFNLFKFVEQLGAVPLQNVAHFVTCVKQSRNRVVVQSAERERNLLVFILDELVGLFVVVNQATKKLIFHRWWRKRVTIQIPAHISTHNHVGPSQELANLDFVVFLTGDRGWVECALKSVRALVVDHYLAIIAGGSD